MRIGAAEDFGAYVVAPALADFSQEHSVWNSILWRAAVFSACRNAKRIHLGRCGPATVSAVEGIELTAAMDAEFGEFDRKGLSAEEWRKAIVLKYGQSR